MRAILCRFKEAKNEIEQRKGALAKLLRGAKLGLQLNEHIAEPGDIVDDLSPDSAAARSLVSQKERRPQH